MKALLWTTLIVSFGTGFISILSADEADKTTDKTAMEVEQPAIAEPATAGNETNTDTETEVDTETDTEVNTETEVDTDTETEVDTGDIDSETDSDTETDTGDTDSETDTEDTDSGTDTGDTDTAEAAATPEGPPPPEVEVAAPEVEEEEPPQLMYAKGDMDTTVGISLSGDGNVNYLGFSAAYAYYLRDRLAPGVKISYTTVLGESDTDYGYSESFTLLPLLKFVLSRKQVAPYIFATGGYEWQWGSRSAANAWILGLGGGVNVAVSKRVMINIELAALHYWYIKKKVYWYKDSDLLTLQDGSAKIFKESCESSNDCGADDIADDFEAEEGQYVFEDPDGNTYLCQDEETCGEDAVFSDKKDKDREWFFPLISVGVTIAF